MINREGKNLSKQQQPNHSAANDGMVPFYDELMEQKKAAAQKQQIPGPGQYQLNTGFDKIKKQMNQVMHLKNQGLESYCASIVKNSCSFQSRKNRFENKELREKAMLPGPGYYD